MDASAITDNATEIVVAVLAAGGFTAVREGLKRRADRKAANTPEGLAAQRVTIADSTLTVVAKARDELEEDNTRLRVLIVEERKRHAEDREVWAREKAVLRSEIDGLETRLRVLLDEVAALRSRTS